MHSLAVPFGRMKKSRILSVAFVAGFLAGMMVLVAYGCSVATHSREPAFKVLVVASSDPDHAAMITKAGPFLKALAAENHFALDFTRDTSQINETSLAGYQAFIQLHLAPFNMSASQQRVLQKFIEDPLSERILVGECLCGRVMQRGAKSEI